MKYILSIDQGTTGTTAVLINASDFSFIAKVNEEFSQIFPLPGLVEHDLSDIWTSIESTVSKVLSKADISAKDIISIGITNQRETICAFSKSGQPLENAIVWQDRRTTSFCLEHKDKYLAASFDIKSGLPLDPYFSATKINWLLNNSKKVIEARSSNDLLFGTIDTFLLYKLTKGLSYKTEASNASRTLLMDLDSCQWSSELLSFFAVDEANLPEICDSFHLFGQTLGLSFLPDGIPITGILGDQQSALFGQAGVNPGDMKCTYGTGAFMLLNTGSTIKSSQHGLLSTVAFQHAGETTYALEGCCYIAGAAVQWLRDNLNIIDSSTQIEKLALEISNLSEMEHLLFLPFFSGLGTPYWNSQAQAAILGLTRDTSTAHLARACLDGIALSINDLIISLSSDMGKEIRTLKVDGGASANNLLMSMQASLSDLTIIRPKIIETTAFGAALAAAIGLNLISFSDISKFWKQDKSFTPIVKDQEYFKKKYSQWVQSIAKIY